MNIKVDFNGISLLVLIVMLWTQSVFASPPSNPNAIAVIIANSQYKNQIPKVDYAGNDGDAMKAFVKDVLGYREGNIIDMRNAGQADMNAVFGIERSHQGKLWSWVKPGRSDVFVFYSGHGAPGLNDRRGYLLPVDSDQATVEINGYPLDLLYRNLAKLKARSVTVMLDACFSGASEGGMLIEAASPVFVKTVASEVSNGITVLSAARGDQVASWDREAKLGLFTNYVLKGLYGEADGGVWGDGDGQVTLAEVRAYLDDEMSYAARRRFTRIQQASAIGDPKTVLVAAIPDMGLKRPVPQQPIPVTKISRKPILDLGGKYRVHMNWQSDANNNYYDHEFGCVSEIKVENSGEIPEQFIHCEHDDRPSKDWYVSGEVTEFGDIPKLRIWNAYYFGEYRLKGTIKHVIGRSLHNKFWTLRIDLEKIS